MFDGVLPAGVGPHFGSVTLWLGVPQKSLDLSLSPGTGLLLYKQSREGISFVLLLLTVQEVGLEPCQFKCPRRLTLYSRELASLPDSEVKQLLVSKQKCWP